MLIVRTAILLPGNRFELSVLLVNVVPKNGAVAVDMLMFNGSRNASWHQAGLQALQLFESLHLLSFERHPMKLWQ